VHDLPGVEVRSLYDRYPDFDIDVAGEQQALLRAEVVVWQSPFYWYGVPALLHHWFEKVLAHGWAYGEGGKMLVGKRVLWVTTTGAPSDAYGPRGVHGFPFQAFVPAMEQTARFCGMSWEPPLVVHGAHRIADTELAACASTYRERLVALMRGEERADG
jgi:glutathione-regulated potassium-efflux system ancillary protein KefF